MLCVVVPDISAYDAFYKKLIGVMPLTEVTSWFAMETIRYRTVLPVPGAGQ